MFMKTEREVNVKYKLPSSGHGWLSSQGMYFTYFEPQLYLCFILSYYF